jgi:hypothetical protein
MANLIELSKLKITTANVFDKKFIKPVVSNRNRLEGLPRTAEFDRGLRAEIADPLWMLCRQWQFGEFDGEDAATAYQAKILGHHQRPEIIEYKNADSKAYDFTYEPLETAVEKENLKVDLYLKIQMGRQFLSILKTVGLKNMANIFIEKYPIVENINIDDREAIYLNECTLGFYPDGHKIWEDMNTGVFSFWLSGIADLSAADLDTLTNSVTTQFNLWFDLLYQQSDIQQAWEPSRMEYNFAMKLPVKEQRQDIYLEAKEYAAGHLDWCAFDENQKININEGNNEQQQPEEVVQTFIPTPLKYSGMPHPRFWQMEDSLTNFGKTETGTTGILTLLLHEYGLSYSNDWFVLPYQLQMNTYCEIKGLMVTDIFGQNILIEPTFKDPELNWHEFALFRHTEIQNKTSPRNRFYLSPSALKIQEGDNLEKVNFMRDEMANMVWGIENTVPSQAGGGRLLKLNSSRFDQNFVPVSDEAKIRYLLGSTVPDNWIPFVPVHKIDSDQEIRLQRAKIPNAPTPESKLLTEQQPVHFIEEEEVPRAGVIVKRNFKRTRWLGGKTKLWVGRSKTTGRGEGWSGLMFDQILPINSDKRF